jgi:hypothetical protein
VQIQKPTKASTVQPRAGPNATRRSPNEAGVRPRAHSEAKSSAATISAMSCTNVAEITRPGGPLVVTLPPPASTPAAISR